MDSALRDPDTPVDLSPLAWVQEELRRSLESVHKTLRRLVRDGGDNRLSAFGAETQPSVPLQQAAAQLHQVSGVLSLVGLPAGATVLRAAETAVQRLAEHPLEVEPGTVDTIERANFALLAYVARLLAGSKTSTLALYPGYRELQQLNGAERIHPADLWQFDWSWRTVALEEGIAPRSPDSMRAAFEAALLRHMREPSPQHAAQLSNLCAGLAAALPAGPGRTLWQLAAAVFEGQALKLLGSDAYLKRLGSRLLNELRRVGRPDVDEAQRERLAQDLLFFCAQCRISQGAGPRLLAVHAAYRLTEDQAGDYEDASLGRIDPAWVAQARRRVAAAKDSWSSAAEGDQHRAAGLDEQFAALSESLGRLFPSGEVLAQTLQRAVVATLRSGEAPAPALAMEVATSLLYVEAALEDAAFDQPEQGERVRRLASRVESVAHGQPAEALEDWMEELYRRVSDKQTLGSVVHELRASLSEIERQADEYFRHPTQRELLIPVPAQLSAMRGVFSVLGLDQAAHACLRMRDDVDGLANTEIDFERAGALGVFERLANNLGALGFMIDMLSVQPQLAKRMFQFDESSGRLDPVMGRREGAVELPDFEASGFHLEAIEAAAAAPTPAPVAAPLPSLADYELPSLDLPDLAPPPAVVPAPVPAAVPSVAEPSVADDPEMREIFLEEAQEVLGNAQAALAVLQEHPADHGQLTIVRRAFHTLKGSARMVGLNEFGEGAWACEQLYNARLAEAQPVADAALLGFTGEALAYFEQWREQIAGLQAGTVSATPLRESADALRLRGERLPVHGEPAVVEPAALVEETLVAAEELAELPLETIEAEPFDALQAPAVPEVLELPLAPDFSLDLDLPAAPAEPAVEPLSTEAAEPLVLDVFEPELPAVAEVQELASEVEPEPLLEPVTTTLPDLALDLAEPVEADAEALQPLPTAEAVELELADLAMPEVVELPEAGIDLAPVALPEPEAVPAAAPHLTLVEPSAPEPEEDPDEGFKLIGPLRISITLFNIFLNEADELSRRLCVSLAEWAAEPGQPLPASCEAQAHALAGNAGTVGYDDLSALARALEHALGRAQRATAFAPEDVELFVSAAEDVRRLLHQFAAGFLKSNDAEQLRRLEAYEPQEMAETQPLDLDTELAADAGEGAEPDTELATLDLPLVTEVSATSAQPALPDEPEPEPDAEDHIDAELYGIFEDEGRELLVQLHASLRDWLAQPAELSRSDATMRALHTFKGGARLAGAMRLGQLAHALESHVEAVLRGGADAYQLHLLQSEADALDQAFDRQGALLRAPVATPEPAPVEAASVPGLVPDEQPERLPEPAPAALTAPVDGSSGGDSATAGEIDWTRFSDDVESHSSADSLAIGQAQVRVRGSLLERMATQAGEVSIRRSRLESELAQMKGALLDLDDNLERLRAQLRELELQAEAQMHTQQELAQAGGREFDPLEFDRYTRFQELTRMLAESVGDVATLQRTLSRNVQSGEDELAAQSRLTRELQDELLRTRLVEFDSVAERMHRVVRQAARDTGKLVRLEIAGGQTELDRSVLERMAGAFEHLLRNSVSHGIEAPELRAQSGKDREGVLRIEVRQQGNEVLLGFADDGAGLNLARIRERALQLGLLNEGDAVDDAQLRRFIFAPGFSTADQVTELAGRGVGMDVVRSEVGTLGGSIETTSVAGAGTSFLLRLPLTTALTQIVLLRAGEQVVAVPAALMESVQRLPVEAVEAAYASGRLSWNGEELPFHWLGGLLGQAGHGQLLGHHVPVLIVRTPQASLALHVDEVVGNQEVVVKNLGAQLNKVPGLAGISLLASGDVALIYNVVALADWYGAAARLRQQAGQPADVDAVDEHGLAPLVLVVDDSLTVRRVTQRLLERVGLRVSLAKDGLDAMEKLAGDELPAVVLSDIEMPRMDGFDLVRNMRADARLARLPVIMITSRIAQKHRDYAEQLGVQHYLGKPYDEEQLLALVHQYTQAAVA
ncbi:MAG: hybrid sensor histidine kinase/response regulator [Roseateles depolymerans]|uniref:Chemotaxis protein CheA n=1 Tax=Roseateles depolymerans TaxID=76731 RepID=A0A2W5D6C7_9BURK|nr:MAG: hybrid sensor histidine kinase/response regulator [Roseateles depolymerans]